MYTKWQYLDRVPDPLIHFMKQYRLLRNVAIKGFTKFDPMVFLEMCNVPGFDGVSSIKDEQERWVSDTVHRWIIDLLFEQ